VFDPTTNSCLGGIDGGVSAAFGELIVLSSSATPGGRLGAWSGGVRSDRTCPRRDGMDALLELGVADVEDRRLRFVLPFDDDPLPVIAGFITLLYVKYETDGSQAYQAC
jgi:hypothetical protein